MAEQFYTILTKIGKAKIANATALGIKVNLTKFQVGDSNGAYYNPTEDQTELKNKVWEGKINNIKIDEQNPNWIIIEVLLPSNVGGFMIREAAILDDEDNIVAIAKYPETYKPQTQDGSSKDILIRTILEITNASSVTLKVDPTVILATKEDIEILENKIKNIEIPVKSVNNKTGSIELTANDIKTKDGQTIETKLDEQTKIAVTDSINLNRKSCAINPLNILNYTGGNLVQQNQPIKINTGKNKINYSSELQISRGNKIKFVSVKEKVKENEMQLAENMKQITDINKDLKEKISQKGGEFTGIVKAQSNTSYTIKQLRNIILSPNDANVSLMDDGDIWIKYK